MEVAERKCRNWGGRTWRMRTMMRWASGGAKRPIHHAPGAARPQPCAAPPPQAYQLATHAWLPCGACPRPHDARHATWPPRPPTHNAPHRPPCGQAPRVRRCRFRARARWRLRQWRWRALTGQRRTSTTGTCLRRLRCSPPRVTHTCATDPPGEPRSETSQLRLARAPAKLGRYTRFR